MAKTNEFQHDEDFDSDRETIRSHQKDALKNLEDSINKFKSGDQSVKVSNIIDRKLFCDFPIIHVLPEAEKK